MAGLFIPEAVKAARAFARGLSARLLGLTVLFVMIAEVLIFLPSAASFRSAWIARKLEAAQLASLAVEAAPQGMVPMALGEEILAGAGARSVALKRFGQRQLLLQGDPIDGPVVMVDRRKPAMWRSILDTLGTMGAPEGRFLRIMDMPRLEGGEFIEIIVAEAPLKRELAAFSGRIAGLSILISLFTGALVYGTLLYVLVGPLRRLAQAMTRFREAPEDPGRAIAPTQRSDEIGQAERELALLQEQVRQALRQKERLAALGAAVAKINHDLRNVLTAAQLVSDRLAANQDPQVRNQAARLVRAIDRGVALAEEVLAYGRAEERPPQRRPVLLRAALEEAFADAAAVSEAPTGLDLKVDDGLVVLADPDHVHRIFLNLLRNAVQAMAAQENRPAPGMIALSARQENAGVVVAIADNGPGIPERARPSLFQPFASRSRTGGSGLGLSIARELARANGGEVTLAGTGATGSTFEVRLAAG